MPFDRHKEKRLVRYEETECLLELCRCGGGDRSRRKSGEGAETSQVLRPKVDNLIRPVRNNVGGPWEALASRLATVKVER